MLPETLRAIQDRCNVVSAAAMVNGEDGPRLKTGWPEVDAALGSGLPTGLHEWFGPLVQPGRADSPSLPPFCVLVHLGWRLIEQSARSRWMVWIGEKRIPYPPVFRRGDTNDPRLLRRSLFVCARDGPTRQWAADAAMRCEAVQAAIVDGSGFDKAVTRRLHLLARARDKWLWLIRPPSERSVLSAAISRWVITWNDGTRSKDVSVNPGWRLKLVRCKGMPVEMFPEWLLEWDHATGALHLLPPMAGTVGDAPTSSLVGQRYRA